MRGVETKPPVGSFSCSSAPSELQNPAALATGSQPCHAIFAQSFWIALREDRFQGAIAKENRRRIYYDWRHCGNSGNLGCITHASARVLACLPTAHFLVAPTEAVTNPRFVTEFGDW